MAKDVKVDFLDTQHDKAARRMTVTIAVCFALFVAVLSAVGAGASYRSANRGTNIFMEIGNLPVISDIRRLVIGEGANAQDPTSTPDGRMNVMIFGVGGGTHNGSQLTDTIILMSVDLKGDRVGMLSIPRDLAYPLGGTQFQKINAVNAYAEQAHPGEGAQIAAKDIGKLLGVRIDHVVKIDFTGFEKFIDALGGLDIDVQRSFVDNTYPTDDEQWQTVEFTKGQQHMDGKRALIYVRSRHGTGGEGSDFARSARQQQVIAAVREKLLSAGTLLNPGKIADLWGVVSSNLQSDLSVWDMVKLAPLATRIDSSSMVTHVLTQEELNPANVDGSYMLFPKKPDWSDIRTLAQNPFETKAEMEAKARPTEPVVVEVRNGTMHTGFAAGVGDILKRYGYTVSGMGNAVRRGYEKSVIFDLTAGKKPTELARLKKLLDANVSSVLPSWISGASSQRVVYSEGMSAEPVESTTTEFLIILGESSFGLFGAEVQ
ncbi:MAG: LCP family protein [Patescibacteria group bacterium]